ncbi:MAG: capsule biosynthesis GfcC family protein [Gammaproteobacteria bacterium]|nr:capsule biosynthesis GfcC family protein [Gammaproteobacteria bacterium]
MVASDAFDFHSGTQAVGGGALSMRVSSRFIGRWIVSLLLSLPFSVGVCAPPQTVQIVFKGCVNEPSTYAVQSPVRLSAVLELAAVQDCAYWHGASWLKAGNQPEQLKLKTALLEEVNLLIEAAESETLQRHLRILHDQIEAMPVTGRTVPSDLDMFRVETRPLKNRLVVEDSVFWLPKRPTQLYFLGFEQGAMDYFSTQTVSDYWEKNALKPDYEKGWVYVVQANGKIEKHKVGYWTHEQAYVAPGGWIVAPLKESLFDATDDRISRDGFYRQLTQWLATQVIQP